MDAEYKPIKLPSKCLLYDGIEPDSIGIRTLKGKDEKLIAEVNYENFEKKFLLLLKNVLQGIDPAKLTVGDRLFILLWEAINSYSKEFDVEHTCFDCYEKITTTVDLSQLDVIELPDDFKEPHELKLGDGSVVKLKLFRVEDEVNIAEYEKTDKSSWLYRWATTIIKSENGKELNIWDKISYLSGLASKDLALIRAVQTKYAHGPKMEANYSCPKCGGAGVVPVPFRTEMLFPYGKALERYYGDAV